MTYEPACALYLIERPASPVVALADMKAHCGVDADDTDDDGLIEAYTDAVTQALDGRDGELGRALVDQTWELRMSGFPCGPIEIPLPPLIEIVSVKYIDSDGVEQTYSAANYHVTGVGDRGRVALKSGASWPTLGCGWPEPVIIQFRAGYIDTGDSPPTANVPAPIIAAIKLLTEDLYDIRRTVVVGQTVIETQAAKNLLRPYIVYR